MSGILAQWQEPLPGAVEPKWWTGQPQTPLNSYTIDCSIYPMDESSPAAGGELAQRMQDMFDQHGLVYLSQTGLRDLSAMRRVAKLVVGAEMNYEGGSNPRGNLAANVYEIGAPLSAWLHYHHEMAYVGHSTRSLAFLCKAALPGRGFTYVSDNLKATEAILETKLGQKLKKLGLCYHRDMTDRRAFEGTEELGVYNHWQKSMLTEDPDQAIEKARGKGLVAEWGDNGLLKTRYYVSAFEYFAPLDRNLLFSSVADDGVWFDSWPKVMHLPLSQRPLKLTFGDDTEMTSDEKRLFIDIYDRFGMPIPWHVGDIAIVCNYRFAHGRPAIQLNEGEARELGVVIGDAFERVGDLPGKW